MRGNLNVIGIACYLVASGLLEGENEISTPPVKKVKRTRIRRPQHSEKHSQAIFEVLKTDGTVKRLKGLFSWLMGDIPKYLIW